MNFIMKLDTLFERISENYIIKSIRQGLLYNMPLIMVGSFVLMALNLPIESVNYILNALFGDSWETVCLAVYNGTFSIMSLTTLLAISYAAVREYNKKYTRNHNPIIVTLASLSCFVAISSPSNAILGNARIGTTGMFGAIVMAISATSVYLFIGDHLPQKRKVYAHDTDAILQSSLANVLPALLTISIFALIRIFGELSGITDLFSILETEMNKLFLNGGNHFITFILYCFATHIMWFFGIHGTNVLEQLSQDLFQPSTDINIALAGSGQIPTEILTKEFMNNFVFLGGAGCTLGLLIALYFAGRSGNTGGIARYSVFPGIFNINEIMVYGLPIIFNPYFIAPFLLSPIILGITSYIAFSFGLVPLTSAEVVWTTPIFISGYTSTGSFAGSFLQLFNLVLAAVIYLPFVRLYEVRVARNNVRIFQQLTAEYNHATADNPPMMVDRKDELGIIARSLATELKAALEGADTGLYMAYQPKTRRGGKVFGAESLLRWNHPIYGAVSPLVIIGIADECDLTVELGSWVLNESFGQLYHWRMAGYDLTLSVNLSPKQIREDEHLAEQIDRMLKQYKLTPELMELELTEHSAIDVSPATQEKLHKVKDLGINISIDDFGMGSSSLLYLRDFYASIVKLDISLVQTIHTSRYSQEIVRSIISLCRQLNAEVVAEGVELKEQLDILTELGCDQFQGWYFSKALSAEDFILYLNSHGITDHQVL